MRQAKEKGWNLKEVQEHRAELSTQIRIGLLITRSSQIKRGKVGKKRIMRNTTVDGKGMRGQSIQNNSNGPTKNRKLGMSLHREESQMREVQKSNNRPDPTKLI